MKNDFREYDDYLIHSFWKKHKYIRKEGDRYIYREGTDPEVKKAKARDRSYKIRNFLSKITGKNSRFLKNTTMKQVDGSRRFKGNINDYKYEQAQRAARNSYNNMLKKKEREQQQLKAAKANKLYYDKQAQMKLAKENQSRIAYNQIDKQARSQGISAAEKRKQDNLKKITDFINNTYSNAHKAKVDKEQFKKDNIQKLTDFVKAVRKRKTPKSNRR